MADPYANVTPERLVIALAMCAAAFGLLVVWYFRGFPKTAEQEAEEPEPGAGWPLISWIWQLIMSRPAGREASEEVNAAAADEAADSEVDVIAIASTDAKEPLTFDIDDEDVQARIAMLGALIRAGQIRDRAASIESLFGVKRAGTNRLNSPYQQIKRQVDRLAGDGKETEAERDARIAAVVAQSHK